MYADDNDKFLSKATKSDILPLLEGWFSDATDWDKTWRDNAKLWYDYYHGTQWTAEEIETLTERGQAVTTYNHIAPAIDSIIGGERQNRPEISMAGRTIDDEQIAQVKTELYKYISYNTASDDEQDSMVKDLLVTGRGWFSIYPQTKGKEFVDIIHNYVDYRDMFTDSYSKKDDLSDARYVHHAVFTDEDVIKKSFPNYMPNNDSFSAYNGFETSSEDEMFYYKGNRKRPRLINTWYRDEKGDMATAVWVKGQLLYFKKMPFTFNGFPFVQVTYKTDLNNLPYGVVKTMTSAQDEVNKRHSKAMHYLNAKQVLAEEDAFKDWNEAKKTLARPDGVTKLNDGALAEGRVQIVDNTQLANTHIQLMEHAKQEVLALAGLNSSFIGQNSQYQSAKSSQMAISQASNALVPILNKIRQARHRIAYVTMQLVPDFYTEERMIRILEPSGNYAFMPINKIMLVDNGTFKRMNDITNDDIDIIIEDAPRGLDDRAEQFNQLLGIQGQTGRPIPMEILLRYSNLKNKNQLADELKQYYAVDAQVQQAQQYIQQLEQQLQQMGGQVNQIQSQLVQANLARAVEKEVQKAKNDIDKEKQSIIGGMRNGL